MKIKNLFALVAVVFASFIQMGCGTSTPSTVGYNQYQNGCAVGQSLINGYCQVTTTNPAVTCSSGASYQGSTYGCQQGYTMQGNTCVCNTSVNTTGVTNGQCQLAGYYYLNYPSYGIQGCYQQGPCYQGYALYTPSGMCVRVQ